jgi:predicted AAA+ superfamily ATPase
MLGPPFNFLRKYLPLLSTSRHGVFRPARELRTVDGAALSRAQLFERVVLGGFPAAHDLPSARLRAAWFGDYVRTLLQRDLAELRRAGTSR